MQQTVSDIVNARRIIDTACGVCNPLPLGTAVVEADAVQQLGA
jgi:hypothetical protein